MLKELIKKRGYTQKSFAEAVGVGPSTINNLVNRKAKPDRSLRKKIATRLGVEDKALFDYFNSFDLSKYKKEGKKLERLRIAITLSKTALAERIGVTYSCIANYEAGRTKPAKKYFVSLSRAMGVDIGTIYGADRDF